MFIFEWDLALLSVLGEADDNVQGPFRKNPVNQNFPSWLSAIWFHIRRTHPSYPM